MKNFLIHSPYEGLPLFSGIANIDIPKALHCLGGKEKKFERGESVICFGEAINHLGILLQGQAYLYNLSSLGERNIITQLQRGDLIGGSMLFSKENLSPYGVVSIDQSIVLLLSPEELNLNMESSCPFRNRIIKNLLSLIAEENNALRIKLEITGAKSLREKIFQYLLFQAGINKQSTFNIPFKKRADFADYLGVNPSALSRELSRMREEGILDFYKNSFILKVYSTICVEKETR